MAELLKKNSAIINNLTPLYVMHQTPIIDRKQLKLKRGAYAQVNIGTKNTTKERTVASITLYHSNEQGGYYFMPLSTGG